MPLGVWDRVADCESGGDWSINTGNGYSGGVQFSHSTWRAYGGEEFAPLAYQASREQQIIVAERVLDDAGWGAWPTCSRNSACAAIALVCHVAQRASAGTVSDARLTAERLPRHASTPSSVASEVSRCYTPSLASNHR